MTLQYVCLCLHFLAYIFAQSNIQHNFFDCPVVFVCWNVFFFYYKCVPPGSEIKEEYIKCNIIFDPSTKQNTQERYSTSPLSLMLPKEQRFFCYCLITLSAFSLWSEILCKETILCFTLFSENGAIKYLVDIFWVTCSQIIYYRSLDLHIKYINPW